MELKKVEDKHQLIVSEWFLEKNGRIADFYKKYYSSFEKPGKSWVNKVLRDFKEDLQYNIWLNAYEYYLDKVDEERRIKQMGERIMEISK